MRTNEKGDTASGFSVSAFNRLKKTPSRMKPFAVSSVLPPRSVSMKPALLAVCLAVPMFADTCWQDRAEARRLRAEIRRDILETTREARRARMEARMEMHRERVRVAREFRRDTAEAARELRRERQEAARERMRARLEMSRNARETAREVRRAFRENW